MTLNSGQILQGRYNIIQFIGQGGMSVVYLGVDTRLGNHQVAIKQMNPASLPTADQQWAIMTFKQEAVVLARLNHPAIARVMDFFQEGQFWYLVMEYVAGETLDAALSRFPRGISEEQVLDWAAQLGSALDYLHQQSPPVIFRDLKPGNVVVQLDGTLKMIDFGIARYFKPGQNQDTIRLGTPGYAAPEQYGRGQTDARSDIFSLGVLLHQLLTGYDPALSPMDLPPIRSLRPDVSPRVAQAVEQAMRPAPSQRYGSVREFGTALGISISGSTSLIRPRMILPIRWSEWIKQLQEGGQQISKRINISNQPSSPPELKPSEFKLRRSPTRAFYNVLGRKRHRLIRNLTQQLKKTNGSIIALVGFRGVGTSYIADKVYDRLDKRRGKLVVIPVDLSLKNADEILKNLLLSLEQKKNKLKRRPRKAVIDAYDELVVDIPPQKRRIIWGRRPPGEREVTLGFPIEITLKPFPLKQAIL